MIMRLFFILQRRTSIAFGMGLLCGCLFFHYWKGEREQPTTHHSSHRQIEYGEYYYDLVKRYPTLHYKGSDEDLQQPYVPPTQPHIYTQPFADLLPHSRHRKFIDPLVLLTSSSEVVRSPPRIVYAIPTIRRSHVNYLHNTLKSLFSNLKEEEWSLVKFVILIAERQQHDPLVDKFVNRTVGAIRAEFFAELDAGLIDVLMTPMEWYPPDLDFIQPTTFNDSLERISWRTKQNIDYAYLMNYVKTFHPQSLYYVQLEDDIETVSRYTSAILRFVDTRSNWMMCEFSHLGFIGKLMRVTDLYIYVHFILLLHRDLPVDWIMDQMFLLKFCPRISATGKCTLQQIGKTFRILHRPPLFQHKGHFSSLDGKVQKLKESSFGRAQEYPPLRSFNAEPVKFYYNLPLLNGYNDGGNDTERVLLDFYRISTPLRIDFRRERRKNLDVNEVSDGDFIEFYFSEGSVMKGVNILFAYVAERSHQTRASDVDRSRDAESQSAAVEGSAATLPFRVSISCRFPLELGDSDDDNDDHRVKTRDECVQPVLANHFADTRTDAAITYHHVFDAPLAVSRLRVDFVKMMETRMLDRRLNITRLSLL